MQEKELTENEFCEKLDEARLWSMTDLRKGNMRTELHVVEDNEYRIYYSPRVTDPENLKYYEHIARMIRNPGERRERQS